MGVWMVERNGKKNVVTLESQKINNLKTLIPQNIL